MSLLVAAALWLSPVPTRDPPPALDFRQVYRSGDVHVGVAAHVLVTPDEVGLALTGQVTCRVPW